MHSVSGYEETSRCGRESTIWEVVRERAMNGCERMSVGNMERGRLMDGGERVLVGDVERGRSSL